jgi:hypothetical protein
LTGTLPDIAGHIRCDRSNESIKDVGYLKAKPLDISRKKRYRQAVLILGEIFYLI